MQDVQQQQEADSYAGKTRAVDDMGRNGKEEDLLARIIGYGGIQSELHHQGCLGCPPVSQEPQPMEKTPRADFGRLH